MASESIVVFSGGSAANNLVDVFGNLAKDKNCSLSYIIPISDNGGSSSELIRVFGGPGIGDVRSRLVRLIPENPTSPSKAALKTLFNHRLSPTSQSLALTEWNDLLSATHPLWTSIPLSKKELIRSFLNHLQLEISKRTRPPTNTFNFQSASIGNLFLTGARLFSGSFESAIYLLGSITGVPEIVNVIPAINSNFSHHICAGLRDGQCIVGQNSISHPSGGEGDVDPVSPMGEGDFGSLDGSLDEDANLPGSHPNLRNRRNIVFSKEADGTPDLPSPIERIWYINPYGQPIHPHPSTTVLSTLKTSQTLIYSIGSLYTSIIPCLILRDVGRIIASTRGIRYKILILNGSLDRETGLGGGYGVGVEGERGEGRGKVGGKGGGKGKEYDALDFVEAIVRALEEGMGSGSETSTSTNSSTLTSISTTSPTATSTPSLTPTTSTATAPSITPTSTTPAQHPKPKQYTPYITHLIHLTGPGTPHVPISLLKTHGIETVRVYGRKEGGGMIYDAKALGQALEAIIGCNRGEGGNSGRGGGRGRGDVSRRNTVCSDG